MFSDKLFMHAHVLFHLPMPAAFLAHPILHDSLILITFGKKVKIVKLFFMHNTKHNTWHTLNLTFS